MLNNLLDHVSALSTRFVEVEAKNRSAASGLRNPRDRTENRLLEKSKAKHKRKAVGLKTLDGFVGPCFGGKTPVCRGA